MLERVDLFVLFRWVLVTVTTVYTVLRLIQALHRSLAFFSRSRQTEILGHYAAVLLLRSRVRLLAWDLAQIAVLTGILSFLVYCHLRPGAAH